MKISEIGYKKLPMPSPDFLVEDINRTVATASNMVQFLYENGITWQIYKSACEEIDKLKKQK